MKFNKTDDSVRDLLQQDARTTFKGMQKKLGIGSAAANTILHDHLAISRRCARSVPPSAVR